MFWALQEGDPLMSDFFYLCAAIGLIGGLFNIFAPATMLTCPNCGVKTRHYRVNDKSKRRVFKCDVCGHKGILSPRIAPESEASEVKDEAARSVMEAYGISSPKAPKPKRFCINCGKELITESKLCDSCGTEQP